MTSSARWCSRNLHKLIDESLFVCSLRKSSANSLRAPSLLYRALGCASQLAPPLDEELLVLRLVTCLLLQPLKLFFGVGESLYAKAPHSAIVSDSAEQLADSRANLLSPCALLSAVLKRSMLCALSSNFC